MMNKCSGKGCWLHCLAMVANIGLIGVILFISMEARGQEQYFVLLFLIPPVLSLMAMKRHDREERSLKKRIRKAQLRKDLKELSEFDKTE